jgi:hypothetical protein
MKSGVMKGVAVLALVFGVGMVVDAQSPRAVIEEVWGTVELKAPRSSVWEAALPGQEVTRETEISTGFKSSAVVRLGNSTLLVKPLTRLSLGAIQAAADTEQVDVQLRAGRIRANVNPPAAGQGVNFTVRSPSATASVRGTVFEFDTQNLTVAEGTVQFSGADNTAVYVQAGQSSAPDPVSGKAAAPVEVSAGTQATLPAGVEDIAIPAAIIPPAVIPGAVIPDAVVPDEDAVPDTGELRVGTKWWN